MSIDGNTGIQPPNPLAYQGAVAVPFIDKTFAPLSTNNTFGVPTIWVNTATKNAWLLTAKPLGVANWLNLGSSTNAPLVTLTGDTGGALTGDSNQNINILGTANEILVTGSGHTLTLSLAGGGEAIDSFQPDSGTNPVVPDVNGLVIMAGSGSITTVGGTNTLTFELTGLTNHAVLVGAGTTTITKVGPSATVGAAFIGKGSSADPAFSTTFKVDDTNAIATLTGVGANLPKLIVSNTSGTDFAGIISQAISPKTGLFSCGQSDTPLYWNFGMASTLSNAFAINTSNAFHAPEGGTVVLILSQAGQLTLPLQPAFLGILGTTATNKTGNGASYTIGTDALTIIYDNGSNFNTNGTFTAPVNGTYDLRAQVTVSATTVATSFVVTIVVAGMAARSYANTFTRAAASTNQSVSVSVLAHMAATDTATVTIVASGEAGNTDSILSTQTWFCGTLTS